MRNLNITLYKNVLYNLSVCLIVFFACFARIFVYLQNRPLWRDECALALNVINAASFEQFLTPLNYDQCAPLFFMLFSKIMTIFFGASELVLRFLPFFLSLCSIFLFYYLTKNIFKNRFATVIANALFAFNVPLIYYTQEFKQYGVDVFVCLLALIIFSKFNIQKYNVKKSVLFGFLAFLPLLLSYTYAFVAGAYLFYEIVKSKARLNKNFYAFFVTLLIFALTFSCFILLPSRSAMMGTNPQYWQNGFITSLLGAVRIFVENLRYYFAPNTLVLFSVLLSLFGFLHVLKRADKKTYALILLSLAFGIFASILNIYPIMKRLALWSVPSLIILITAGFDFNYTKSKKSFLGFLLLLVLFVFSFFGYFGGYLKSFCKNGVYSIVTYFHSSEDARYGLKLVKQNLDAENETLVLNVASVVEYEYYSKYFNFVLENIIVINPTGYSREQYFKELEKNLKKGKTYVFYHSYDYMSAKVSPYLEEWILKNAKKIHFIEKYDRSYFVKITY